MTLGGGSAMERSDRKFHDAIRRAELYSGERLDQSCHFKSYQPGDVGLEHCDTVKSERQEFTRARGGNVSSSRHSGVQQENLSRAC